MSPDRPWKATERAVGRALGGKRVPITGRQRGDVPDVAHESLSIEVKRRQGRAFPMWLREALDQAEASALESCMRDGIARTPIVVVESANGRGHRNEWFVVLTWAAFQELVEE